MKPPVIVDSTALASQWGRIKCDMCGGHGVVSDFGLGYDFDGPKECKECWGSGHLWRSPNNRLAVYPGGPFRGMA
jgi:hypothetical protein